MPQSSRVLVVGGGPAGLSAALDLSDAGADVTLVEKEEFLGGTPKKLHYSLIAPDLRNVDEVLGPLIERANRTSLSIRTGCTVSGVEKREGEFLVTIKELGSGKEKQQSFSAVVLATGFSHWDPHKKYEYGYGVYPDVIDFKDFEGMLSTEKIVRPSDGKAPKRIAWLLCVGSRDRQVGKFYCCRMGCVVSIKQAMEVRQKHPDIDTYVYYMDIRTYGFWEDKVYWKAMEEYNVNFVRGRIGSINRGDDGRLLAMAEDTILQRPSEVPFDMVVLATGMEASEGTREMARLFGIELEEHGFIKPLDADSMPVLTGVEGVFVAGAATAPKSISDSVTEGSAAAMKVLGYLAKRRMLSVNFSERAKV
jgi:heterodisulfide reductase subunit A